MAPHPIRQFIYSILAVLSVFGVIETVLVRGFLLSESLPVLTVTRIGYTAIIVLYIAWLAIGIFWTGWRIRRFIPDLVLSAILLGTWFPNNVDGSIVSFRFALSLLIRFFRTSGITTFMKAVQITPARILLFTFLGGIIGGACFLMLPAATTDHRGAVFVDALFTSASAICVTGLTIKDTGTYFTGFGQAVILGLIQVGGLGIMTFSTLYTILLGRRLGWRQEAHMREIMETPSVNQMYRLIVGIVTGTLLFEFIGSVILTIRFLHDMGFRLAVKNAFCNAGFSLFPQNLMNYPGDITVNLVVMTLIVIGGIGFVVIDDIRSAVKGWNPFTLRWSRLSVHTKLVLITTASLITIGTLFIFFLEFDNTMLNLTSPQKFLAAIFQSVTCRTAGFNTIDIVACRDVTLFFMIVLMFIGASPASTGGGVKTSTLAILILAVRAHLRSREKVEVFKKSIPPQTVFKAISIILFSLSFIIIAVVFLLMSQTGEFLTVLFESVSALGTVGLTAGLTPQLDTTGKMIITMLMYVGRVGPLSIALAFGEPKKVTIDYPTTRILVG
jgi:trk system potassium uptake protein TrkH